MQKKDACKMMASKRASLLFSLPVTVFEPCRPTTTLPPLKCAVSVPCWPRLAAGAAVASRSADEDQNALKIKSREIIGKRKSSSAPGSNSSRSSSHQAGAEARRPRVRAPLRLETLLFCRSEPRGRPRLEEGPPDLGADLLATRDRGGASSNHTHNPLYCLYTTTYNRPTKLASWEMNHSPFSAREVLN